ncbi:hypothetical protein [Sulfitobacter aestuariivivens]|uniref:hypothetical protein n=1 Tax=Sulfitobacter aestuariivivens TaxID=2766981 RepID=UPI0036DF0FDC
MVRDFIYVEDLADLCVRTLTRPRAGVYNAGSGVGVSINDIVGTIRRVVDQDGVPYMPTYTPGRACDVPRVVLDTTRAREAFDWEPRKPLPAGIRATWDWVKDAASPRG